MEKKDNKENTIGVKTEMVRFLRKQTGVSIIACKKALQIAKGDYNKAVKELKIQGFLSAAKKIKRQTNAGYIFSYVHRGKIGVLVEINCETDFVAKHKIFQNLGKDIAMQIASSSDEIQYISEEDIPKSIIEYERKMDLEREDLKNKEQKIKDKVVIERIQKLKKNRTLLNQEFIKDKNITIDELIKNNIMILDEKIKISRFCRYILRN
ncbi:MAG: elongation factor Ts [Alphaproteobacteria bacterium]|nr:elongation factor Ts [Alphaproteobacteria bacterium]